MIRVLELDQSEIFFKAVDLMDRYLWARQTEVRAVLPESMHLVGLVSILMSTKFQNSSLLLMSDFLKKVGHNKFSKERVLGLEADIMKSIGFELAKPTLADTT